MSSNGGDDTVYEFESQIPASIGEAEDTLMRDTGNLSIDLGSNNEELEDNPLLDDLNNNGRGDHDLVDVKAFKSLITRQTLVESNFSKLNANVTRLTEAVTTLTKKQVPPVFASQGQSSSLGHGPSRGHQARDTPSMPSKSRDVDDFSGLQLKNVQIPKFKGNEKDCSKDAVHTFIQKWTDIHDLRATLDRARSKETSLSLKGKAYKWWMAMNYNTRPKSWKDF